MALPGAVSGRSVVYDRIACMTELSWEGLLCSSSGVPPFVGLGLLQCSLACERVGWVGVGGLLLYALGPCLAPSR